MLNMRITSCKHTVNNFDSIYKKAQIANFFSNNFSNFSKFFSNIIDCDLTLKHQFQISQLIIICFFKTESFRINLKLFLFKI